MPDVSDIPVDTFNMFVTQEHEWTKVTSFRVVFTQTDIRNIIKSRGYDIPDNTPIADDDGNEFLELIAEWTATEIINSEKEKKNG
jgi:hypothetical protein